MDVIGRPERAPDRIWRCPNCGHLCRRAGHITERCDGKSVEYVRSDLHRGAVEALQAIVDLPCPLGRDGDLLGRAQRIASEAITAAGGQSE